VASGTPLDDLWCWHRRWSVNVDLIRRALTHRCTRAHRVREQPRLWRGTPVAAGSIVKEKLRNL